MAATEHGDLELISGSQKRRRGANLGNFRGEIRINEFRYQAFVNPVFQPLPSKSYNTDSDDVDSVDGIHEELEVAPESLSQLIRYYTSDESPTSINCSSSHVMSCDHHRPFNLSRSRRIPRQSPYLADSPRCGGPYRAYSPSLFDDATSSVAAFTDADQLRLLGAPSRLSQREACIERSSSSSAASQPDPPQSSLSQVNHQNSPPSQQSFSSQSDVSATDPSRSPNRSEEALSTSTTGRCPPSRGKPINSQTPSQVSQTEKVSVGSPSKQPISPIISTRLQMKEFAANIRRQALRQKSTYLSQRRNQTTRKSSGSYEYLILMDITRNHQSLFCSIDPLSLDSELYRLVSSDVRRIVRARKREGRSSTEPTLTVKDCWKYRPLIKYLVEKNILRVMTPTAIIDPQKEAEIADDADNRLRPTLEVTMWERLANISEQATTTVGVDWKPSGQLSPFNDKDVVMGDDISSSHTNRSPEVREEGDSQIQPLPSSFGSYDDFCEAFKSLSTRMSELSQWKNNIQELHRLHNGQRAPLEVAERIYQEGLHLNRICNLSTDLVFLKMKIDRCCEFRDKLKRDIPGLFESTSRMSKTTTPKATLEQLQPLLQESESLPFYLQEGALLTREVKTVVGWQAMVGEAVAGRDLDKCKDLVDKGSTGSVELQGMNGLKGHVKAAQWLEKLQRVLSGKKPFNQNQLEDLLLGLPEISSSIGKSSIDELFCRCEQIRQWVVKLMSKPLVEIISPIDRDELERFAVICSRNGTPLPQIPLTQEGRQLPTPEQLEEICNDYCILKVQLNIFKSLEAIRLRYQRWVKKYRRATQCRNSVSFTELTNIVKEGKSIGDYLDLSQALDTLEAVIMEYNTIVTEVDDFLNRLRQSIAQVDLSRASNDLITVEALAARSLRDDEPIDLSSYVHLMNDADRSNRPNFDDLSQLIERLEESPIIDSERERHLQQVKDQVERWRRRAKECLKAPRSSSQMERLRFQLLVEARHLAVDTGLESKLSALFYLHIWRKRLAQTVCPITESDLYELSTTPKERGFESLLDARHSIKSVLFPQEVPEEEIIMKMNRRRGTRAKTMKEREDTALAFRLSVGMSDGNEKLNDDEMSMKGLVCEENKVELEKDPISPSMTQQTNVIQNERCEIWNEMLDDLTEEEFLPALLTIIENWKEVINEGTRSKEEWKDILTELDGEVVKMSSIEYLVEGYLRKGRDIEKRIRDMSEEISLKELEQLELEVSKCPMIVNEWEPFKELLAKIREYENKAQELLITHPVNRNLSGFLEFLDNVNINDNQFRCRIAIDSLPLISKLKSRVQSIQQWIESDNGMKTTTKKGYPIEEWSTHLSRAKDLNLELAEIHQLENDTTTSQNWINLYYSCCVVTVPRGKAPNKIELEVAELLVEKNFGLGDKLSTFRELKNDLNKTKEYIDQLSSLLEESRRQLAEDHYFRASRESKLRNPILERILELDDLLTQLANDLQSLTYITSTTNLELIQNEVSRYSADSDIVGTTTTCDHFVLLRVCWYNYILKPLPWYVLQQYLRMLFMKAFLCLFSSSSMIPFTAAQVVFHELESLNLEKKMEQPSVELTDISSALLLFEQRYDDERICLLQQKIRERLHQDYNDDQKKLSLWVPIFQNTKMFNELQRRIESTNRWIDDYEELYSWSGLTIPIIDSADEYEWPHDTLEIRERWLMLKEDENDKEQNDKEIIIQQSQWSSSKERTGFRLMSQRADAGKKTARSKTTAHRHITGNTLISETIDCSNLTLRLNTILPEISIRRLAELHKKSSYLKKGRFSLDLSQLDAFVINFGNYNATSDLDYESLVIPSLLNFKRNNPSSSPLQFPRMELWATRLSKLFSSSEQITNHSDISNRLRVPTIIKALRLLQASKQNVYFEILQPEILQQTIAVILAWSATIPMQQSTINEFPMYNQLLQFHTLHGTSIPLSLLCDSSALTPQCILELIEQCDLLPFQVPAKQYLIFELLKSLNWGTQARETLLLLRQGSIPRPWSHLIDPDSHGTTPPIELVADQLTLHQSALAQCLLGMNYESILSEVNSQLCLYHPTSLPDIKSSLLPLSDQDKLTSSQQALLWSSMLIGYHQDHELGICGLCGRQAPDEQIVASSYVVDQQQNNGALLSYRWLSCDECQRWFHNCCIGLSIDTISELCPDELAEWHFCCPICLTRKSSYMQGTTLDTNSVALVSVPQTVSPNFKVESSIVLNSPWLQLWSSPSTSGSAQVLPSLRKFKELFNDPSGVFSIQPEREIVAHRFSLLVIWLLDLCATLLPSSVTFKAGLALQHVLVESEGIFPSSVEQLSQLQGTTIYCQNTTTSLSAVSESPHSPAVDVKDDMDTDMNMEVPTSLTVDRRQTRSNTGAIQARSAKILLGSKAPGVRKRTNATIKTIKTENSKEVELKVPLVKKGGKGKKVTTIGPRKRQHTATPSVVLEEAADGFEIRSPLKEIQMSRPGFFHHVVKSTVSNVKGTKIRASSTEASPHEEPMVPRLIVDGLNLCEWISSLHVDCIESLISSCHEFIERFVEMDYCTELKLESIFTIGDMIAAGNRNQKLNIEVSFGRFSSPIQLHPTSPIAPYVVDEGVIHLSSVARLLLSSGMLAIRDIPQMDQLITVLSQLSDFDSKISRICSNFFAPVAEIQSSDCNALTSSLFGDDTYHISELHGRLSAEKLVRRVLSFSPCAAFCTPAQLHLIRLIKSAEETRSSITACLAAACPKEFLFILSITTRISLGERKGLSLPTLSCKYLEALRQYAVQYFRPSLVKLFDLLVDLARVHSEGVAIIEGRVSSTTQSSVSSPTRGGPPSRRDSLQSIKNESNTVSVTLETITDVLLRFENVWELWVAEWKKLIQHESSEVKTSEESPKKKRKISSMESLTNAKRMKLNVHNLHSSEQELEEKSLHATYSSSLSLSSVALKIDHDIDELFLVNTIQSTTTDIDNAPFGLPILRSLKSLHSDGMQLHRQIIALLVAHHTSMRSTSIEDNNSDLVDNCYGVETEKKNETEISGTEVLTDELLDILRGLSPPNPPKKFTLSVLENTVKRSNELHLRFNESDQLCNTLKQHHETLDTIHQYIGVSTLPNEQKMALHDYHRLVRFVECSSCYLGEEETAFLKAKKRVDSWVEAVRKIVRNTSSSSTNTSTRNREEMLTLAINLKKEATTLIVNLSRTRLFADLRRLIKETRRRLAPQITPARDGTSSFGTTMTEADGMSDTSSAWRSHHHHHHPPQSASSYQPPAHYHQPTSSNFTNSTVDHQTRTNDQTQLEHPNFTIPAYSFPLFHPPSLPSYDLSGLHPANFFPNGPHLGSYPPMFLMNGTPGLSSSQSESVTSSEPCPSLIGNGGRSTCESSRETVVAAPTLPSFPPTLTNRVTPSWAYSTAIRTSDPTVEMNTSTEHTSVS